MSELVIDDLPDADDRFELQECLGTGVCGKVYSAVDTGAGGRKVAIKMQRINKETIAYIQEEFKVLETYSSHPNIVDFYGAFRKVGEQDDEVWFVLELCEGGPVIDLVNGLLLRNRRMAEEHIAYILKETVKAVLFLHENRIMHRDLKASNILLTKDGEVKLADFGLARHLSSTLGKSESCIGSPCWMAPEVVISNHDEEDGGYGNRADVWALGITAIELGDGHAPFENMHPTRAMFQIVRNPPPTLYRPTNWSEVYNDFINECLIKNPEHRPYLMEVFEHPFLSELPDNNYHLGQEIKSILQDSKELGRKNRKPKDALVNSNYFKRSRDERMEKMYVEDLAALDKITEEIILLELQARMKQGQFQTFVGDVLLILNPNEHKDIYNKEFHRKYNCKSRSENPPHIYAVADGAYQDALHHIAPQNIVLAGESGSGKTTNYLHLLDHLLFLGKNTNINEDRIKNAVKLIHAFTHSSTPFNDYSTRCVFKTEITFGRTGKVSGAVFHMHQLEKWRVSTIDMSQANYHILYYLYDGLESGGDLEKYNLSPGRQYRYMRTTDRESGNCPRDNPEENVQKFKIINEILQSFEFSEQQIESIFKSLSAVLVLGNVRFREGDQGVGEIENLETANKVAQLLNIEEKKLCWALTNYCLIKQGTAVRRRHNSDEARDARDVLANTIYFRVVDYVINFINFKLSYGARIFGEKYSIRILDLFGFECFKENQLPQLFINCFNEQLHYHYLQRVFAWEALEMNEEGVPYTPIHYYDNKNTLDQILCKPEGVITLIDEASKMSHSGEYIIDYLNNPEREHIKVLNGTKFSIAHYTGKVTYDAKEMPDRNRDFLPPDVIETMRLSKDKIVKSLFSNKLTRTGNLYTSFDEDAPANKSKFKFSSSSSDDDNLNKNSEQQFSQIKKMRTAASTFRSLCLDILKELSVGGGSGGTHFVRCVRTNLEGKPNSFLAEIVKQQIRAMAVVETAKARQKGYPHRVSFNEFIRRYKFLAFDFDENVEVSRDNCRLLLVRLKMEGWLIGKNKVFLKYYNEEYLARLYETQVKKIIKIQCIMRGFLVKMKMKKSLDQTKPRKVVSKDEDGEMDEEQAAIVLQKAYRGLASRKAYGPLVNNDYEKLDAETCKFIRYFCLKWKAKSMFQVLLQYRAARYQDLFNFSQQVHLFNQNANYNLQKFNNNIGLELVDKNAQPIAWLGERKPNVLKLPFRLDEIPFFDTSYMCDPLSNPGMAMEKEEPWDSPFRWRDTVSSQITTSIQQESKISISKPYSSHTKPQATLHRPSVEHLINLPYNRDPNVPVRRLSSMVVEPDYVNCSIQPPADYHKPFQPPPPPSRHPTTPKNHKHRNDHINNNSQPANKDFEYIKPHKSKPSPNINPIAELKNLGRRESASEDDPPFNFQGMLRKTNNRASLKKAIENVRTFSFKGRQNKNSSNESYSNNNGYDSRKGSLRKHRSMEIMHNKEKMQLGPGLFMEGVVADL